MLKTESDFMLFYYITIYHCPLIYVDSKIDRILVNVKMKLACQYETRMYPKLDYSQQSVNYMSK